MKLNRYYIPSRGWAFISVLGIFLGIFLIYETLLNFFMWELPFFNSACEAILSISFTIFLVFLSFCCLLVEVTLAFFSVVRLNLRKKELNADCF